MINITPTKITSLLFVALLSVPMIAQADVEETLFEDVYLNVDENNSQAEVVLNATSVTTDNRVWGNTWGNKIPFKGSVPHGIAALGSIGVAVHFPKI